MDDSPVEFAESAPRPSFLIPLGVAALTATVLVVPMILFGNPSGHDLQPHLASWMDIQGQWREGIWFPRWAEWSNYGFGEPRFIFYPPLSTLLGAALGSILPWKMVPSVLVWLSLFLAAICMYKLASDRLDHRRALIAAVLFAANPYNVIVVYYRAALAELLAAALFPLMLWAVIGVARREWKRAPLLAAVFAAIWLTNTPAAVIASYSLLLVLAVSCVWRRDLRPVLPVAACVLIGLALAAFYVVPAWWEQRWIDLAAIIANGGDPERNFLFAINNSRAFLGFNWIVSAAAVGMMVLTTIAIVLTERRRRARSEIYLTMIILAGFSSLLMLPVSKILWRYVPKLAYLQFPWRWLIVLAAAFAFLVASATTFRSRFFWFVAVCICAAALALSIKVEWRGNDASIVQQKFASGSGYFATTNFTPIGADRTWLEEHTPLLQRVDKSGALAGLDDAHAHIDEWSAERKIFSVQAKENLTLALKLLNYPAWEISIDGHPAAVASYKQNGQMTIDVPAGEHRIEALFRRTRDRAIGAVISLGSLIVLLIATGALWWRDRRVKFKSAPAI